MRRAAAGTIKSARAAPARGFSLSVPIKPLLGGSILLAASIAAFFAVSLLRPFFDSEPTLKPNMHTGSIFIPLAGHSGCRRLKFDNTTGAFKDEGTGQCGESAPGAAERLGMVSQSFQGR